MEGLQVVGRSVALVLSQPVLRVELIELFHAVVALDLCKNRCCGDRNRPRVSVNQGLLFNREIKLESIEEQVVRKRTQLRDGGDHCLSAGLVDVPGIDAAGIDLGRGPCQGVLADAVREFAATLGSQLLGIVEPYDAALGIQDDGCGYDGSEERTSARFIESGDALPTAVSRFALVSGAAEASHRLRILPHSGCDKFHNERIYSVFAAPAATGSNFSACLMRAALPFRARR